MKIRRTIPPAAAPISIRDFCYGIRGMVNKNTMAELEKGIKEYFGTKHVFFVSSGKAALFLILLALKSLRNRTKVVIPAYTCYSVPSAVIKAGLKLVPCDSRPETLDYDFEELSSLIDDDTLCIIPTHLLGIPSDVDRIRNLCKGKGIYMIEDAAQALGGTAGGKKLGTFGDVAFFSLGRGKNVTCGSGGFIITDSKEIADALGKFFGDVKEEPARESMVDILSVILMSTFIRPCLYWFPNGLPFLKIGETKFYNDFPVFRLSRFKAGLLYHWREALEAFNRGRTEIGDFYLKELGLEKTLPIYSKSIPYLRFPVYVEGDRVKDDEYERYRLSGVTRMYPDSVNHIEEISADFRGKDFKNSETIAKTLLTLPTHPLVRNRDKRNICNMVNHLTSEGTAYREGKGRG